MPVIRSDRPVVGLWSGASPSTMPQIRAGLARLKELGFETRIPDKVRRNWIRKESKARAFLAGPDKDKISAFVELWLDPSVTTVLSVRGGYGTIRLLDELDKRLKAPVNAKRVWGFSDLTTLQNWLWGRFRLPWIHSPMLSSHSFSKPNPAEKRAWLECLAPFREGELARHSLKTIHRPKKLVREIRGPLLGGNLACFVSLLGTRFEPRPRKPFLFFIEEIDEYARRIDRWLHQLSSSRYFAKCEGVVLGHLTKCPGAREVVELWAREQGILLLAGLRAGHESPNLPIAMGLDSTLRIKKNGDAELSVPILPFE